VPFVLLANKADLTDDWVLDDETLAGLQAEGWTVIRTSAKTGEGVEEGFNHLANALVG
jgi:signal recognition particle receptor subunit beta